MQGMSFGVKGGDSRLVLKDDRGRERPVNEAELRVIGLQERARRLMRWGTGPLGLVAGYYVEVGAEAAALAKAMDYQDVLEAMSDADRFLEWVSEQARSTMRFRALLAEIEANMMKEEARSLDAGRLAFRCFLEETEL